MSQTESKPAIQAWTADSALVTVAQESLLKHVAMFDAQEEGTAIDGVLEAAGTLALLNHPNVHVSVDVVMAIHRRIEEWSFDELGRASIDILRLVENSHMDAVGMEHARLAMKARDAVELRLQGVRFLLGFKVQLSDEQLSALDSFEEMVRPVIQQIPISSHRYYSQIPNEPFGDSKTFGEAWDAAKDWMAPEYRERFWWWSLGNTLQQRMNET